MDLFSYLIQILLICTQGKSLLPIETQRAVISDCLLKLKNGPAVSSPKLHCLTIFAPNKGM